MIDKLQGKKYDHQHKGKNPYRAEWGDGHFEKFRLLTTDISVNP
jgi:hypothetical protein